MAAYQQLLQLGRDAASHIREECDDLLACAAADADAAADAAANADPIPQRHQSSLLGCGSALVSLLSRQASLLARLDSPDTSTGDLLMKRLEDIISISYSKFYCFLFKDLPLCWRQLYTDASILKFHSLILRTALDAADSSQGTIVLNDDAISELVKTLDLALILAGAAGEQRGRVWIAKALDLLHHVWTSTQPERAGDIIRPAKRAKLNEQGHDDPSPPDDLRCSTVSFSDSQPFTPPVERPIPRRPAMSVEAFQSYMDRPSDSTLGPEPLIFTDLVEEWPARTTNPWHKPSYLLSKTFGGHRLVPVEIGRSYVDEGWGQKLITFGTLLREYIDSSLSPDTNQSSPADRQIAYLAQHPLLTQLPALRNDILVPDLCYTSPPPHPTDSSKDQPEVDEPMLNAWFGPPGTITPLHNDPYHNLLVQVVGCKYVRLYSPLHNEQMQARGKEDGVEMGNTSSLDVGALEGWDQPAQDQQQLQLPLSPDGQVSEERIRQAFKDVPYVDCILNPGDTLYIPIGWWHYVRGLSVSFSVSFWWN
ncbi:Clavaminate synthase-like protein [Apiospora arundinis]|uniref:Clavaminate synthase-like protein n=1 Tax=Apiospora arundinis TaxID=335852 RepID=A0ABR2IU22_9PEZI